MVSTQGSHYKDLSSVAKYFNFYKAGGKFNKNNCNDKIHFVIPVNAVMSCDINVDIHALFDLIDRQVT